MTRRSEMLSRIGSRRSAATWCSTAPCSAKPRATPCHHRRPRRARGRDSLSTSPRSGALFVNELAVFTQARPRLFLSPLLKTDLLLQNAAPEALEGAMGVAPKIVKKKPDKFRAGVRRPLARRPAARGGLLLLRRPCTSRFCPRAERSRRRAIRCRARSSRDLRRDRAVWRRSGVGRDCNVAAARWCRTRRLLCGSYGTALAQFVRGQAFGRVVRLADSRGDYLADQPVKRDD